MTGLLFRLTVPFSGRRIARLSRRTALLERHARSDARRREIVLENLRMRLELFWMQSRSIGPFPVAPEVDVSGLEHLEEALRAGRGVILWRMSFTSATPLNAALAGRGHAITHLSTEGHLTGNASGPLARRVLGPLLTRDEARFLYERVVMVEGRMTGYLPRLSRALEGNGVVTIVGDSGRGRVRRSTRAGELRFLVPSGAPSLSHSSGAALLPCAAIRVGPMAYRLIIHPDVAPSRELGRRPFREEAIARYSRLRLDMMERHPGSEGLH